MIAWRIHCESNATIVAWQEDLVALEKDGGEVDLSEADCSKWIDFLVCVEVDVFDLIVDF